MSQTKTLTADLGTAQRITTSSGNKVGAGDGTRFYTGRRGSYDFEAYVRFAMDWTNVGRIVRATLSLYVDDGLGQEGDTFASTDTPRLRVRRLTNNFSEHDGHSSWSSADETNPGAGHAGTAIAVNASTSPLELVEVDVTPFLGAWAPTTVTRADGGKGSAATNYGLRLYGSGDTHENGAFVSEDAEAPLAAYKPIITLEYEYGLTVPTTPDDLSPSGTVSTFTEFAADFADVDTADQLRTSGVQVYDAAHTISAISTGDSVSSTAHGLVAGDKVVFTSLTGGTGLTAFTEYFVIASGLSANAFKVSATLNGSAVNVTDAYSAGEWSRLLYNQTLAETSAAIIAARTAHVPSTWSPATSTTYRWRIRVTDQESQTSAWTALTSFVLDNTVPVATVLPATGSYDTLDGVMFEVGFSDADGDLFAGYQIQLSAYAEGAPEWDDAAYILWDTGRRVGIGGEDSVRTPYGGAGLDTDTYYWRARVWDDRNGASDWEYATLDLTADFEPLIEASINNIQLRPRAPWRIVIKEMKFNAVGGNVTGNATTNVLTTATAHGLRVGQPVRFSALTGGTGLVVATEYFVLTVPTTTTFTVSATFGGSVLDFSTAVTAGTMTRVTTRGPGDTVAVLEDVFNVGASLLYNSPGEAHWTMRKAHPQISVIEPKLTHYAIEFRQGDGWREVFAGLVDDFDAAGNDIVFYGIDYLGLLQRCADLRYDPNNIDKDYTKGGSKFTNKTPTTIITNVLNTVRARTNSPVGFISTGSIASMSALLTIFSTYEPTLQFIAGLLDSQRAGSGSYMRISVNKTSSGYEFVVAEPAGTARDNLRLRYGELVQGYRVIPFGKDWSTKVAAVGRDRDGVKVRYSTVASETVNENVYGEFVSTAYFDGVSDGNDFNRRTRQAASSASVLGKQLGIGLRSNFLQPRDGYELCDKFLVDIEDGPVSTSAMGHGGYWRAIGITWQALQRGDLNTTLTLAPDESDSSPPSSDLLTLQPISTQAEWQIGYTGPTDVPTAPVSRYWLDQTTGIVYERVDGAIIVSGITGAI